VSDDNFIPFHRPSIGKEELDAVQQVLVSRWLTTGPAVQQFEREFARYIGCEHALAVNSATAALHLALDAIGLRPGDEVLVPTYTFTSTAEVVTYFGARPVLCDSVYGAFNIDPSDAEKRITSRTRAIIPVHIAGEPCDLDAIHRIAETHNLHVIEDAAHALPASFHGNRIGTTSELTAFSFYATKTITTGEGGMLTTDNDDFAQRVTRMRLHGISGDAWKRYSKEGSWYYEILDAGYKANLCDLLAAVGSAQLAKCDDFANRRRSISEIYRSSFAEFEELENPPAPPNCIESAWHLFILRIHPGLISLTRNQFVDELKRSGIGTSVHFIPLHLHPFYKSAYGYRRGDYPNAEEAYSRCLSLPIFPDMSSTEIDRVIRSVSEIVFRNRKPLSVAA
jgi:dTDP-4-amino-4,6-dideoxygalactose transaminase